MDGCKKEPKRGFQPVSRQRRRSSERGRIKVPGAGKAGVKGHAWFPSL